MLLKLKALTMSFNWEPAVNLAKIKEGQAVHEKIQVG
jgi:Cu/Ag efflux protein CusF